MLLEYVFTTKAKIFKLFRRNNDKFMLLLTLFLTNLWIITLILSYLLDIIFLYKSNLLTILIIPKVLNLYLFLI